MQQNGSHEMELGVRRLAPQLSSRLAPRLWAGAAMGRVILAH